MKLAGFIGSAYTLDSVNVDCQRCVNLYPEVIESGYGKGGQVGYLRGTPGLEKILEVGSGPIRLIHVDSIGRIFVVSGNRLYLVARKADWKLIVEPTAFASKSFSCLIDVDTTTDEITVTAHPFHTGLKVRLTKPPGSDVFPTPLVVDTDYWVINVDADTIQLASSFADAMANTPINITAEGNAIVSVVPQIPVAQKNIKFSDIDFGTDSITKFDHPFYDGLQVTVVASGKYPGGVAASTNYFVTGSNEDTFKLAASISDAAAGTAIDLTDVSDELLVVEIGSLGEYGGDLVTLATSMGAVKAASLSFRGDGTDSSTVFVDGVNNYLYLDETTEDQFGILGSLVSAKAVLNLVDDITIEVQEDFQDWVGLNIAIQQVAFDPGSEDAQVEFEYWDPPLAGTGKLFIQVAVPSSTSFTTADLVELINTGAVAGKTVRLTDSDNKRELLTASGGGSEFIDNSLFVTGTFTTSSAADFGYTSVPTATTIRWSDGYFILNEAGTNRFKVSDLQSFNVDTLSFTSSEGSPDIVLALEVLNRNLYVFNEETTEVYANTGNADFPFERVGGGFIEVGVQAPESVCKAGVKICFLGRSKDGAGIVYAIEGLSPQRISTHAIEQAIRSYANPENASAWTYQSGGHRFYALNFDEATWVYDFTTGRWHERAYTNEGVLERHRVQHCAYIKDQNVHYVSDYETNEIYLLKEDVYTDDGDAITRLRAAPHLSSGMNRLFFSRFQLDMEVGIGLDGGVQGSNPTVMLDWSNDSGHTWSSEQWALADAGSGQIGDFKKRVQWRRLGSARDRVFRVKITDPVKVRLIDAWIDVEEGVS